MSKRIAIYTKALNNQIETVVSALRDIDAELEREAGKYDHPPYPWISIDTLMDTYHVSRIGVVVHSCLLYMKNHMSEMSPEEWHFCIEEYLALPPRAERPESRGEVTSDVTIDPPLIELADEIADYIRANDIKVPYITSRWGTSYKVVISLAIIFTARGIKEHRIRQN